MRTSKGTGWFSGVIGNRSAVTALNRRCSRVPHAGRKGHSPGKAAKPQGGVFPVELSNGERGEIASLSRLLERGGAKVVDASLSVQKKRVSKACVATLAPKSYVSPSKQ